MGGIDLTDEQEKLFSVDKGGKASILSQRVIHEEDEEMFLAGTYMQGKLKDIISKCGLDGVSEDVEYCLLLGLVEMMHGFIRNMIRMSKQRVDLEKTRHQTLVTSDLRHQIMVMNQEAQGHEEKRVDKSSGGTTDGDIDKFADSPQTAPATKARKERTGVAMMLQTAVANKAL